LCSVQLNYLSPNGGSSAGDYTHQVMARLINNDLAEQFAWVAINTKEYCFSTLELTKLVIG
jgi:hypothetical protein